MRRDLSSYRDPDGYVAYAGDEVYRRVLNPKAPVLQKKYKKFFEEAVKRGLLLPFEEKNSAGGITDLKVERLPLVTYPYEWGFEQLQDAALLTLDLCLLALEHGLTLKDATAFNVQQYKGRMIFIDHTSFEPSDNRLPWNPYMQLCRHFIVPLLIMSYRGRNANKLFRLCLDGPEIEEACLSLPLRARFRPGVFLHVYLHHFLINKHKDKNERVQASSARAQGRPGSQKIYIEYLRNFIRKIRPPKYATEWHDYYNKTNYDDQAFRTKEDIIERIAARKKYKCVWDTGANNGHFSRILSRHAGLVVSMDIDHAAIDQNYLLNKKEGKANIYPLVMDLTNPSPALGFNNKERTEFTARSKPELIVALALIHHLAVTHNIPFDMQVRYFHDLGADLLIEYVDRDDSQFQKLLANKSDDFPLYTKEKFETAFGEFFNLTEKNEIAGTCRTLYMMEPKK